MRSRAYAWQALAPVRSQDKPSSRAVVGANTGQEWSPKV